jgi:hypothetical protein
LLDKLKAELIKKHATNASNSRDVWSGCSGWCVETQAGAEAVVVLTQLSIQNGETLVCSFFLKL